MSLVTVEPFAHQYDFVEGETILEAALRNNVFLRYGCKFGGCGSCKVRLLEGDVSEVRSSFALSLDERSQDVVLACTAIPTEECVIDTSVSGLTASEYFAGDRSRSFSASLRKLDNLCHNITRLCLELEEPIEFLAGQFVNIQVPGTSEWRSFSVASPPDTPYVVELIVRRYPGGAFSSYLATARVDDRMMLQGPYGSLRIHASHRPILMVAGGSGLAPLLSILRDLVARGSEREVVMYFGARTVADLYLVDEICRLGEKLGRFQFSAVLSESWPAHWSGQTGLVTEALAEKYDRFTHDVYVCGPPVMVDAVRELVISRGVRPRNVYFDAFSPAVA